MRSLLLVVIYSGIALPVASTTRTTSYTYNALGLIESINGPRTDVEDISTFAYDEQGNLIKHTNALGHETRISSHTANGLPLTLIDGNNVTTTLSYDARGRLLSRTIDGQTTVFEYDGVGNIIKTTLPNGTFLVHEYDAAQRLVAVKDNQDNRISYTLDAAGNRTQEEVSDSHGRLTRTLSHTYDSLGRLIKSMGGSNQSIAYDKNGNPVKVTVDADGLNQQTVYAFDALNRLFRQTDANEGISTYTYDSRNNLTRVIDAKGLTTNYT